MSKSSTYLNITLTVLAALHIFVTSVNSDDYFLRSNTLHF